MKEIRRVLYKRIEMSIRNPFISRVESYLVEERGVETKPLWKGESHTLSPQPRGMILRIG